MCMDKSRYFQQKKIIIKELETLTQTIRICSQDIEMELGIENCAMPIMKSRQREAEGGKEVPNTERLERSKFVSAWEYWK